MVSDTPCCLDDSGAQSLCDAGATVGYGGCICDVKQKRPTSKLRIRTSATA